MSNDTSSNSDLTSANAAMDAARTNLQNLEAKLTGLQSARPSFIANNTFAQAKAYDQDITDTQLAIEQAKLQFQAAETALFDALYVQDQQQKTLIFSAATLTNSVFWAMFDDAYVNAATRLMSVIEAAEVMCRQIADINANNRPEGVTPLGYAGTVLDLIRAKLYIPDCDGRQAYFMRRQRTVAYAEGADPVADFLKEVTDKASSVLAQAKTSLAPTT